MIKEANEYETRKMELIKMHEKIVELETVLDLVKEDFCRLESEFCDKYPSKYFNEVLPILRNDVPPTEFY
jgi:hypothetical protein